MIERATFRDTLRLNDLVLEEKLYKDWEDDFTHEFSKYDTLSQFIRDPHTWVISSSPKSVFIATPMQESHVLYRIHLGIGKSERGRLAVGYAKDTVRWFFDNNTTAQKLIGFVPIYNKKAIIFSKLVGFEMEGLITRSVMKKGKLHDLVILSLNRGGI